MYHHTSHASNPRINFHFSHVSTYETVAHFRPCRHVSTPLFQAFDLRHFCMSSRNPNKMIIQCEFKKRGNLDSILKFLSVDDSICIFLSWHIDHSYWVRDGCSAIIFVKHVKTVFVQVHNAGRMRELLLCCESSGNCHHAAQTTPTWGGGGMTCFYKIDCRAAIHGRIRMNNVPHESRIIMLSCTEISFVTPFFFDFEKFGGKPGAHYGSSQWMTSSMKYPPGFPCSF